MFVKNLEYSLLILISLLLLVWTLPGVSAVRNILFGLILLICIFLLYKSNSNRSISYNKLKPIFLTYVIFLVWVIAGAVFFAIDMKSSLWEIRGQLGFTTILIFIAYILGSKGSSYLTPKYLLTVVFSVLFLFILYHDLSAFRYYIEHAEIPFRTYGLSAGLDELNYLLLFLLPIFFVELLFRIFKYKRVLPVDNFMFSVMFLMTIASLVIQLKRNGVLSVCLLLIFMILIYFLVKKKESPSQFKKIMVYAITLFTLVVGIIFISIQSDKRWNSFSETLSIVLNTDTSDVVASGNSRVRAKLSNGKMVEYSNYQRLVFVKEGLLLIKENPLGVGYSRRAFTTGVEAKYSISRGGTHAHSGIIDLGVGTGIVGLVLWTTLIGLIIIIGLKEFFQNKSYFGLLAAALAMSFYFRMFIDSINKDHMLQQFAFLVTLYLVLIFKENENRIIEKN